MGAFQKVNAKYLPLYMAEFQFRYNQWETPDKAAERSYWIHQTWINKITLAIALVVAGGAIYSAIISNQAMNAAIRAANEAARQADAAFADQRPWLRPAVTLTGLKFLENRDAQISVLFGVKNVGRSPATNIRSRITGAVMTKDTTINKNTAQKSQCELAEKDARNALFPGAILFPGEDAEKDGAGAIGVSGNGTLTVGHETYTAAWARPDYFGLQVIGCFDYGLSSGDHGQSGFAYDLERRLAEGHSGGFVPNPGIIDLTAVLFTRDPFSGGYFR